MFVHKIKFNFSIKSLLKYKKTFAHKICYREGLSFLKNKQTPVNSIVTRLMVRGNYLKLLKTINFFYSNYFLNFIKKLPKNNEFFHTQKLSHSLKDFNRILFWKIGNINSLFNIKKIKTRVFIYYLRKEHRRSTVLYWIKQILKMKRYDIGNNSFELFKPLCFLLTNNENNNSLFKIKLKIYKVRLIRGF